VTAQPTLHEGRTVLVTGAAGDLGRAVTRRLLATGGRVVALDRDSEALRALADAHGGTVATRPVDVGDEGDVDAAFAWALATAGSLDGVFNNAGVDGGLTAG
jgi:NAD(P)-dependent dehydrogenase (short-subunit alcohol dehydrogenase family)